ncbi:hypothetical protein ACOBV8_21695 (plasmid) [Pseudoalteromonas espejiana]
MKQLLGRAFREDLELAHDFADREKPDFYRNMPVQRANRGGF